MTTGSRHQGEDGASGALRDAILEQTRSISARAEQEDWVGVLRLAESRIELLERYFLLDDADSGVARSVLAQDHAIQELVSRRRDAVQDELLKERAGSRAARSYLAES